jgi:hypothetical protein
MSRYRKPVHIPRPDEEPEVDDLRYHYEDRTLDFIISEALEREQFEIGGRYDGRRVWKVA